MLRSLLFAVVLLAVHFSVRAQVTGVYINEIAAGNTSGLMDEFWEYPDWLELYNSGSSTADLQGFYLTDDPSDTHKWQFPQLSIDPGQYLILFASGRDIYNVHAIWATLIDSGDSWKYILPDAATPSGWPAPDFDDSGWMNGRSGFGYGDGDDTTSLPQGTISIYLRTTFTIDDLQNVLKGVFHIDYDDAFVAYINGTEIARANIGKAGEQVAFNEFADNADHEAGMYRGRAPDMFVIDDIGSLLVEGENTLAVEVHNAGATSSDMTAIPFLTIGFRHFEGTPYVSEVLNLPGVITHTNFKLSRDGEFLGLYDAAGSIVDTITFGMQRMNISYGRDASDPSVTGFFNERTPGYENSAISLSFTEKPSFSIPGGFYTGQQTLTLNCDSPEAEIYYTLDGTTPGTQSLRYTSPLILDSTTVIRAMAMSNGLISSEVVTMTYFIDEPVNLPFISLVTDPDNLFSDERGIYVTGTNGVTGYCSDIKRNVNQDWERPVNIEFYDKTGKMCLNQGAGVKIFGGCSRTRHPIKSLALFARGEYGKNSFDYRLFPEREMDEYQAFILRSSADDQNSTMMRDAVAQYLQKEFTNIDIQAYRPVVVFINGAYWGIHNMREKINEHYVAGNYGVDPDDVNLLEFNGHAVHGKADDYQALIDYVSNTNLSNSKNYARVRKWMDVDEYIDYQVSNIYMAELDWPGNNIKYWNTNSLHHRRWRWIMYDRDVSLRPGRIHIDALEMATAPDAPGWPNPPWSTLLFRRLLMNSEFRNQFIQMFAFHINTTFDPDRANAIIDEIKQGIEAEIPRHISRWGGQVDPDMNESWKPAPIFNSVEEWEANVEGMRRFIRERPPYAIEHVEKMFDIDSIAQLSVMVQNPGAGVVKMYNKPLPEGYKGIHFRYIPIVLRAVARHGWRFLHWEYEGVDGRKQFENREIRITIQRNSSITAVFTEETTALTPVVIINEINYHSPDDPDAGDWLELYNNRPDFVDISGWVLKDGDDGHAFSFREGTEIAPYGYLVVCESMDDFAAVYPEVQNFIGDLDFKFKNSGEVIRLFDQSGILIDSVKYDDKEPWPEAADGDGATLELIHPDLNNDIAANWAALGRLGTPGQRNQTVTALSSAPIEKEPMKIYPNPADGLARITFTVERAGKVSLKFMDINGRVVKRVSKTYLNPGIYTMNLNTGNMPAGIYFCNLVTNGRYPDARRLVVIH